MVLPLVPSTKTSKLALRGIELPTALSRKSGTEASPQAWTESSVPWNVPPRRECAGDCTKHSQIGMVEGIVAAERRVAWLVGHPRSKRALADHGAKRLRDCERRLIVHRPVEVDQLHVQFGDIEG